MTENEAGWQATVTVRLSDPVLGEWLERALRPEAAREVPRAGASIRQAPDGSVEVAMVARGAGALRAALNTYRGWIDLSLATSRAARARLGGRT